MKFIPMEEIAKGGQAAADVAAALRPGQYLHAMPYSDCIQVGEGAAIKGLVRLAYRELDGEVITAVPAGYEL